MRPGRSLSCTAQLPPGLVDCSPAYPLQERTAEQGQSPSTGVHLRSQVPRKSLFGNARWLRRTGPPCRIALPDRALDYCFSIEALPGKEAPTREGQAGTQATSEISWSPDSG